MMQNGLWRVAAMHSERAFLKLTDKKFVQTKSGSQHNRAEQKGINDYIIIRAISPGSESRRGDLKMGPSHGSTGRLKGMHMRFSKVLTDSTPECVRTRMGAQL
jgi:hypothetical protein